MTSLTMQSTFQDIRDLLEEEDEIFTQVIEEVSKSNDESTKCAFYFFMALALGGVDDAESYQENFLNLVSSDDMLPKYSKNDKLEKWSKMCRTFVKPSIKYKYKLNQDYNNDLSSVFNNTTLQDFYRKEKMDVKNEEGENIFEHIEWYFYDENKAKKNLNRIIDCLIETQKAKIQETKIQEEKRKKALMESYKVVEPQYQLLLANKQLIMNSAPGTGKTFSARGKLADKLLDICYESEEEKKAHKKIRMDMVQFHPSYDYTDFIDGIRPDLSGTALKYVLKNGAFKSFCRRAGVIERIHAAGKSVDEETIDEFLYGEEEAIKQFWKDRIKADLKNEIEKSNQKVDEEQEDEIQDEQVDFEIGKLPKFLFIIDEINRAELSKVIGEMMYCLDPDYRGYQGATVTQYSSLATKATFFINEENDKFFIPSNVYIIGTMNDIDRSVGVFDFALRRRFSWYEVKAMEVNDKILETIGVDVLLAPNDYQEQLKELNEEEDDYEEKLENLNANYSDYKKRIKALNEAITETLKLNEHYHLGAAYFAKIKLYFDKANPNYKKAREKVWDNHLAQILNEYVKGRGKEAQVEAIREKFIR